MSNESRRLFLEEQLYTTDSTDFSPRRQTKRADEAGTALTKVSERVGQQIKEIFAKEQKDQISK